MRKLRLVLLILVLVFTFSGCKTTNNAVEDEKISEESPKIENEVVDNSVNEDGKKRIEGPFQEMIAPDFTLKDIDGNEFTLSELKGNSVALVFWTSWWPSCKAEMPVLREVHEEMKDENVKIIGINLIYNDTIKDVLNVIETDKITFPILFDEGSASVAYGIRSIPTVVIIDKEGIVTQHKIGPMTHDELVENLNAGK